MVRKRLAGLVLLLGAIFVGGYLLRAGDRVVPVEVHYRLGDPAGVTRLEAVFTRPGDPEVVARFATEMIGPEVVQKTRLPKGELVVEIRLGDGGGLGPPLRRSLEARKDALIRLELAGEGKR